MPTRPTRTKKAIQEIAKVFNKLASELTSDLNQAVQEIETLKREVRRLKNAPQRITKAASPSRRSNAGRSPRTPRATTNVETSIHTKTHTPTHETHHETTHPSQSSVVFPNEPFNPSPPPEPSGPDNN